MVTCEGRHPSKTAATRPKGEARPQGDGKRRSQPSESEQPQGRHEAQLQALRNEMQGKDEWQTFVVPRKPKPQDDPTPPASPRLLEDGIETSPQEESPSLGSDCEDEELEMARKALEESINAVNASEQRVADLQKAWEDGQAKEEDSEALFEVPPICVQGMEEEDSEALSEVPPICDQGMSGSFRASLDCGQGQPADPVQMPPKEDSEALAEGMEEEEYSCSPADPVQLAEDLQSMCGQVSEQTMWGQGVDPADPVQPSRPSSPWTEYSCSSATQGYSCSPADPVQLAEDLQSRWQQLDAAAREQLVRMLAPVGEDGKVARAG